MSSPITPQRDDFYGQAITVAVAVTSTGATLETCTLPTGIPSIDLDKSHPIISMWFLCTEDDTSASSVVFLPAAEMARGTAPDSSAEWEVTTARTIKHYSGIDKNGILFITYYPKGVQCQ